MNNSTNKNGRHGDRVEGGGENECRQRIKALRGRRANSGRHDTHGFSDVSAFFAHDSNRRLSTTVKRENKSKERQREKVQLIQARALLRQKEKTTFHFSVGKRKPQLAPGYSSLFPRPQQIKNNALTAPQLT